MSSPAPGWTGLNVLRHAQGLSGLLKAPCWQEDCRRKLVQGRQCYQGSHCRQEPGINPKRCGSTICNPLRMKLHATPCCSCPCHVSAFQEILWHARVAASRPSCLALLRPTLEELRVCSHGAKVAVTSARRTTSTIYL